MLLNKENCNPEDLNDSNNDNTTTLETATVRENQDDLDTTNPVFSKLKISTDRAKFLIEQCDTRVANLWKKSNLVLTAEVATFYEVSKQEVIAASNKYSGELESNVSCQFSPRDVVKMGMFLDSPVASVMRHLLIDFVDAWGCESKRDRVLNLLEKESIKNWSDRAIARIAGCSHVYVNKLREDVPETIECNRGDNVIQMTRKKASSVNQLTDEIEREDKGSSPHLLTSLQIKQDSEPPSPLPTIKRTWTQAEHEEAIRSVKEDYQRQLDELDKRITERLNSQIDRNKYSEIEDEIELYKQQLEQALNKVDELSAYKVEIDQLTQQNSRLSQQVEDLSKELRAKRDEIPKIAIAAEAEKLMREEFKKQFGDIDPALHLEALAIQQPTPQTPQKKAFLKRVAIAAFASIAAVFPNSNIEQAAAIALEVPVAEVAVKAKHLNRVGAAICKVESCINKIGCTKDEFEWCIEPYLDIKQYIWDELSPHTKARIKAILTTDLLDETSCGDRKKLEDEPESTPPIPPSPWDESKTWQFQSRVAKYNGEDKTLSWGLQLVKIDLSTICDDWESPQVWLMNFAGSELKLKEHGSAIVIDQDSRYFEEEVSLQSTEDGEWWECVTPANILAKFHKSDLKAV